jgi:hypothetical protein
MNTNAGELRRSGDDAGQGGQKLAALDVFLRGMGSACVGVCLMQWAITSATVAMMDRKLSTQQIRVLVWMDPTEVDETAVLALMEAIKQNAKLRCLALPGKVLGASIAAPLAELLASDDTPIRHLLLGPLFQTRQPVVSGDLGPMGDSAGAALVRSLARNTTLAVLDLSACGVGDETARALGDILRSNTTLTEIILVGNEIGESAEFVRRRNLLC